MHGLISQTNRDDKANAIIENRKGGVTPQFGVGLVEDESFDDIQIQINQLHSPELQDKLLAVEYFVSFLEDQFIPPPMMEDFRNTILMLFNSAEQLPPHHTENLLIILSSIVEFFEPDFDYAAIFNRTWQFLPNHEAFNLLAAIIKQCDAISIEFLNNPEYCLAIKNFLNNESEELRNSAALLILSLSLIEDNIILMREFFEAIIQNIINPHEVSDNVKIYTDILTAFASADAGLTMISEEPQMSVAFKSIIHFEELKARGLKFLLEIGKSSNNCFKIYTKLDVFEFLMNSLASQNKTQIKYALRIFFCIAENGESGIQFLFETGVANSIIEMKHQYDNSIDQLIIELLSCFFYNGNSDIINGLLSDDLIAELMSFLDLESRSLRIAILRALQAIVADLFLQGKTSQLEALAGDDDIMDKIYSITEDFEGQQEGVIANLIYNQLSGEQ